jgi:hypothetical protein
MIVAIADCAVYVVLVERKSGFDNLTTGWNTGEIEFQE